MPILNQPFHNSSLGELIKNKINSSEFTEFNIFSAFAKNSGVLRLKDSIQDFTKQGGTVNAFIGVDLGGTSVDALITLFNICASLTIVHSENSSVFHTKIYSLAGHNAFWYAVGSNNLTLGGLWTNFESCYYEEILGSTKSQIQNQIEDLKRLYLSNKYKCSMRITSLNEIEKLKSNKYVFTEGQMHLNSQTSSFTKGNNFSNKPSTVHLFEKQSAYVPRTTKLKKHLGKTSAPTLVSKKKAFPLKPASSIKPASIAKEFFWFEMRKSTGGSRNILDLSKKGKIMGGSAYKTQYEIANDPKHSLGGVKFFGISPSATKTKKNIFINYQGRDYFPSSILYPKSNKANGTWRIQLKGKDIDDITKDPLSRFGKKGDFVDKILIFDKISDNYYILSLVKSDDSNINALKSKSKFWSVNGNNKHSKSFGFIEN